MALVESVAFKDNTPDELRKLKYGENWPVVYVINNDSEAYIGETVNAAVRTAQHLKNSDRRRLNNISIVSDDTFNKSVILDLENYLISYMSADGKFKLQNSNGGMQLHNYYNRETYERTFSQIWEELKEKGLTVHDISYIVNSDIFKYSPYKALNLDQYRVVDGIIDRLANQKNDTTFIVKGGAGTGKTVLAVYLMKLLNDRSRDMLISEKDLGTEFSYIAENLTKLRELKIGIVIPMQSLRETIKNVFGNIHGLKKNMVLSPVEVPKEQYDLLIVDEAHRLRQRKALSQYPVFDKNNEKLGFGNEGTELDWILKSSRNQIFFYDSMQSVKPSDVDKSRFDALLEGDNTIVYELESQFRCKGGNDYITYIKDILGEKNNISKMEFGNYDIRIFDDVDIMIEAIKEKDRKYGLCRTVAGYSWKWISKKDSTFMDIEIENYKYQWNTHNKDWVNSPNSINEIGCIHTIQGYDLNYAGVIFGNEIKYDQKKEEIVIDKSNYHDLQGKTALNSKEALKEYIVNIYITMMTRGIHGTYVYACDEGLRDYLKTYFKQY